MKSNDSHRPSVLIIDDDLANLSTYTRVFRGHLNMYCTTSAEEAVELIKKRQFDAALVDYAMPGMNGVEFVRHAASIQPDMARLMVTAHAELDSMRQSKEDGLVIHVIAKPWQRDEILRWITNVLQITSMRQSIALMNSSVDSKLKHPVK